jgi:Leucine-rich repeat (LRR) protein
MEEDGCENRGGRSGVLLCIVNRDSPTRGVGMRKQCADELRLLLSAEPGELSFRSLCAFIDTLGDEAETLEALRLVDQHLSTWPEEYRRASRPWWLALCHGYTKLSWKLVRTFTPGGNREDLPAPDSGAIPQFLAAAELGNITRLDLSGLSIADEDVSLIVQSPSLSRLKCLDLDGNNLTNIGLGLLASSRFPQHIREWGLSGNDYDWTGLIQLFTAVRPGTITRLALGNPNIHVDELRRLIELPYCVALQNLELHIDLTPGVANCLAGSSFLSHLNRLGLVDSELDEDALMVFFGSPGVANLEEIDLSRFSASDDLLGVRIVRALCSSRHLNRLTKLSLAGVPLQDVALLLLASANQFPFTTLDCSRTGITDAGIVALKEASALNDVGDLDCSGNAISDRGALALSASPSLPQLRTLDLSKNLVGPDGASALVTSAGLSGLKRLTLRGNQLGNHFTFPSSEVPTRAPIAVLDVWNCNIGDETLRSLLRCPHTPGLTQLYIGHNPSISLDAVQQLLNWPGSSLLSVLDLSYLRLGDALAKLVAHSPNVSRLLVLRMIGCGLTERGAWELANSPYLSRLEELELDPPDLRTILAQSPILRAEARCQQA